MTRDYNDYPDGTPAVDVLDEGLRWHDGRPYKVVRLVCPICGRADLSIESPDTTLRYGDKEECEKCRYPSLRRLVLALSAVSRLHEDLRGQQGHPH
jgi:hypothetical protein